MAKIYRLSDRIKIKIGEITVSISPLSIHDKTEATKMIAVGSLNKDYALTQSGLIHLLKCSLKDIQGLENLDGSPYKLEFEDNKLTENCISDLFNHEMHEKLLMICSSLVKGISEKILDEKGQPIEGVEVLKSEKQSDSVPN